MTADEDERDRGHEAELPDESESPPLAAFIRGAIVVRLHERFGFVEKEAPPPTPETPAELREHLQHPRRRDFKRHDDAETFLRGLRLEPGAMGELRHVLARADRSATLFRLHDDDVIRALGHALVTGSVIVTESSRTQYTDDPDAVSSPASSIDAAAAPTSPAPLAPGAAALVLDALPEDVLPLLEEVQIAGAQVLPEILETLEQIDLTMEKLSLAMASLAPTPSGVPAITAGMTAASASITSTLGEL
jgi:hypothetical protein